MEDPEIGTISHKLRFGDPSLGWDGNAGLAIFLGPYWDEEAGLELGTCWQVWMFGQGEPYLAHRAKPGMHLDERLIIHIMECDTRYHNVAAEVKAHNEKRSRELAKLHAAKEQEIRDQLMTELTRKSRRWTVQR